MEKGLKGLTSDKQMMDILNSIAIIGEHTLQIYIKHKANDISIGRVGLGNDRVDMVNKVVGAKTNV